jgi:hypothetical protein
VRETEEPMQPTVDSLLADSLHMYDDSVRERLHSCVPMVRDVLDRWCANPLIECAPVLLAVATPHSAVLLRADHWLELVETERVKIPPEDVALSLFTTIESTDATAHTDRVMTAVCALLGPAGVQEQIDSAARIALARALPIHVLLLHKEAENIVAAAIVIGVPLPTDVTLH